MYRKVLSLIVFVLILLVLIAPVAVFAQDGTEPPPTAEFEPTAEPTVEATAESVFVPVDTGAGTQTDITVNVPAAEAEGLNIVTLIGVFVSGAVALGAGIKFYQMSGGNVAQTIEGVSQSSEFATLLREAQGVIPQELYRRALDQVDAANERVKEVLAVVSAVTAAIDRITDKPIPPQQGS